MKFQKFSLICFSSILLHCSARADVVLDWNALFLDDIRADNSGPVLSTRSLAILQTAVYDSVNSVVHSHQPYNFQLYAPPGTSAEAAAVGAAYEVTKSLYPALAGWADALYQNWLTNSVLDESLTNGLALGEAIGQLTIQSRASDGSSTDLPYIPSDDPGQWQRTPPFFRPPLAPQWRYVTPFCLDDIEPFVPPPPPTLDSTEYTDALNEVAMLGRNTNTTRTAQQSQTAQFWSDFSYTCTPPGHMFLIASNIASTHTNSLAENARLFALMALAQADSAIVCWEAKYRYNFWRPVTSIRRADEDNNLGTVAITNWASFLVAPNFPSYTSGHSTFSKASTQVLTHFYGTDAITFTVGSDALPVVFRTYTSLADCADEIGRSRIYAGIHFRFDKEEGSRCGARIGDYVSANFLLPNDILPLVRLEGFTNSTPLLRVHSHFDTTFILQASADLNSWQPISTNTALPGGVLVPDPAVAAASPRFFRVVEVREQPGTN